MNEDEYRNIYSKVNQQRCVFEKMTLLRYGGCQYSQKLYLAEREAMSCQSSPAQKNCLLLLNEMREKARFSLQITQADAPLPHSKELRVQAGGMYGLQQYLDNKDTADTKELNNDKLRFDGNVTPPVKNIHQTITDALAAYGDIDKFPFDEIVKTINIFNIPSRKKRRKDS